MINITDRVVGNVNKVSVMNDKEVIRLDFKVKNQVTELLRLSGCDAIYINYQNGNTKDRYLVTDLAVEGDYATFSWTLGRNATRKDGKTFFVVCASVQNEGKIVQEWNTALSFFTVERGLETLTADVEPYSDIFAQLAEEIATKQDKLIAGENITIDGNVISATGGTVDAYTKAETDALLDDKQDKGDYATETELTSGLATKQNTLTAGENITIENDVISASGGGTADYSDLTNKPQINSVTLTGNKSLSDLGIQPSGSYATTTELSTGLAAKVDTSAVKQATGTSATDIMSQKAVTDELSGKLSNPLIFTNVSATFTANSDTGYEDYDYKAVLTCTGVTASMLATVIFSEAQAASGNYALTCVTGADSVTIYSNDNTAITIPTIVAGNPIEVEANYNAQHTYSADEQVVGTWIDGKPLYEKTVVFDFYDASGSNVGTGTTIDIGASNIGECYVVEQYFFDNTVSVGATSQTILPMYNYLGSAIYGYYSLANQKITLQSAASFAKPSGRDIRKLIFLVRYTKTTD